MSTVVSDWDRENIDAIMEGHGDWFTAQLLRLCQKADHQNLHLLRLVFPEVVLLYEEWLDA